MVPETGGGCLMATGCYTILMALHCFKDEQVESVSAHGWKTETGTVRRYNA